MGFDCWLVLVVCEAPAGLAISSSGEMSRVGSPGGWSQWRIFYLQSNEVLIVGENTS